MNYNNYVVLLNQTFNNWMSGIVLFVYNYSINESNRTCTVSGRMAWKTYKTSGDNWYYQWTADTWNIQFWLYENTTLTCNGEQRGTNSQNYNNTGVKTNNYIINLPGGANGGGKKWRSDLSDNVWWGGPYAISDEISWTLPYGDDTSRSFTISGTFGTRSGWSAWYHPWLSGTITLPYLENRSKINRTDNNGSSWSKDRWVWKTTDYGNNWYKVDLSKTTNNGSSWSKVS